MITRRNFVKKLLLSLGVLTAGSIGSIPFIRRFMVEAEPEQEFDFPEAELDSVSTEPLVSFFLLSDLHISVGQQTMTDKLHMALKDITNWDTKLDAVVLGGDLTDLGSLPDYLLLKKILDQYQLPQLYANMGNHDYYDIWLTSKGEFSTETVPNGKTDAMSRERFQTFMAYGDRPYTDAWINGVHLIMVSQDTYVQEQPDVGEGAWYSDEQLNWLRDTMKSHADGKPAMVFIHQPLPAPGSDGRTHQMIRAEAFREILKPYQNVFVLSGHTHRNFVGESHYNWENSFHWFNNASVGRTRIITAGQLATAAQGMYVRVYPHQVIVRGREFSDRTWIDGASWTIPLHK